MRIQSTLTPKEYISAMKEHMEGHFAFGQERFTGFFLGHCFYVTYHSGFDWQYKYNNQKNAAMGYVRKTEEGCEVRCMRFQAFMCPLVFIYVLLLFVGLCVFSSELKNLDLWLRIVIGFGISIVVAPIATLFESISDRSNEGRKAVYSLLLDPTDPFANCYRIQ